MAHSPQILNTVNIEYTKMTEFSIVKTTLQAASAVHVAMLSQMTMFAYIQIITSLTATLVK